MDLTKGGTKEVRHRITLTRYVDGSFQARFEGIDRRSQMLPLLRQCDKLATSLLQKGAKLGDGNSKIELPSPQERKLA